ncbi:amidase [Zopfia rhizophila CBS 207.26]|uniref:Amidase n=1 Tax=Zopfia rhizophila CBS 207.26 TaxID=1314779 RepID=A0A6A6EJ00_9PEZI|nr:amidase [Zopfia rhizophila CBS 207.26]
MNSESNLLPKAHVPGIPPIVDLTLEQIAAGLDEEQFTTEDLVSTYLARIAEVNDEFNAVVEINEDALIQARELDEWRRTQGRKSILHGVPFLLKDSIVTTDKMQATAGSLVLIGAKPSREATVVTKLRAAGAVILGKANMAEWANFRADTTLAGWSPRGGQAKGIYYRGARPHVSSSGTAAAVRLGLCFAAIDSETDGSMVKPAQAHNIVTIKPTTGLVSRASCIPLADTLDTIGPMTRFVKDAAKILKVIAGKCIFDAVTDKIPHDFEPDFNAVCSGITLNGIRLGVPTNFFRDEFPESVLETFARALAVLEEAGASVVHEANIVGVDEYMQLDLWSKEVVMHTDFKTSINRYLQELHTNPYGIKSLDDLIAMTKSIPEEEATSRGTELWEAARGTTPDDANYLFAKEREWRLGNEEGIPGAIKNLKLDALLMPSVPKQSTHFAMFQGTPIIAVPLGFYPADQPLKKRTNGDVYESGPNFPYCLSIWGERFSEEKLIRIAYCFEQLWTPKVTIQPFRMPITELKDWSAF